MRLAARQPRVAGRIHEQPVLRRTGDSRQEAPEGFSARRWVVNTGNANAGTGGGGAESAPFPSVNLVCEKSSVARRRRCSRSPTGVIMEQAAGRKAYWRAFPASSKQLARPAGGKADHGRRIPCPRRSPRRSGSRGAKLTVTGPLPRAPGHDPSGHGDHCSASLRRTPKFASRPIEETGEDGWREQVVQLRHGRLATPRPIDAFHADCGTGGWRFGFRRAERTFRWLEKAVSHPIGPNSSPRPIIRDGEGATKFVTLTGGAGAQRGGMAAKIAYAIAPFAAREDRVFFASDPNLGRILAAVGLRRGSRILITDRIDLFIDAVLVC